MYIEKFPADSLPIWSIFGCFSGYGLVCPFGVLYGDIISQGSDHPSSRFPRDYFRIFSMTSQQESFARLEDGDGKSVRALRTASWGCSTGLALCVGCKDDALSRHMRSITCTPISDARKYLSASWVNAACFRLLRNSENASTMTGSYVFSLIVNWGMASSISAGKR